jgi:hypothetical protein
VLAQAIQTVQSQRVPAEEALKAAMASLGAAQKAALDFLLEAAQTQAGIVRELLRVDTTSATAALGAGFGGLLAKAVERTPAIIDSVAGELSRWLGSGASAAGTQTSGTTEVVPLPDSGPSAADPSPVTAPSVETAGPAPFQQREPESSHPSKPEAGLSKAPPAPESQSLEAVLATLAEEYSAGRNGGEAAQAICERYPAAVASMRQYLAMEDFLVLMWLRQQSALAQPAAEPAFPKFYAELKAAIL